MLSDDFFEYIADEFKSAVEKAYRDGWYDGRESHLNQDEAWECSQSKESLNNNE